MRLYERVVLANYAEIEAIVPLAFDFTADFRDIFEVRGRPAGTAVDSRAAVNCDTVRLRYKGLDGVVRASAITFSEPPSKLASGRAEFIFTVGPGASREIYVEIGPTAEASPSRARYRGAAARAHQNARTIGGRGAPVRTSNRLFNEWLARSRADLALLTTELATGSYPYAGIPWFSTPFGRDAIITALQMLWLDPMLARGVLTFLAQHQAQEISSFQDSAPGKIMHEMRRGEMSALQENPFGRYYGGVDTTPLFVVLVGAYAERTGDMVFVDELWPALHAAMAWIEEKADLNHDGFVDYVRGASTGLANQGWKDSQDSIFHADGTEAIGPIALVEVQGYVFDAPVAVEEHVTAHLAHAIRRTMAVAQRGVAACRGGPLLDGRGGLLRHRPQRRRKAVPRPRLECGPPSIRWAPDRGTRSPGRRATSLACVQLGVGDPHACGGRAAV
jgi:glycogen debranching enzyme